MQVWKIHWRVMLDSEFKTNLATGTDVEATSERGSKFSAEKAIDGDKETYWATPDDITYASLEIELDEPTEVKYVVMQEYIQLGQRVKAFTIEIWNDDAWEEIEHGTTIGYKRIVKIKPVVAEKMRVNITNSKACPLISNVEIY
jgi:alpha-L-fucosidase